MDLNVKEYHKCSKKANVFFFVSKYFSSQGHCFTGLKQEPGLCNPEEANDLLTHETHWFAVLQLECI